MGKAFVKVKRLPGAPAPTKEQHVVLNEDTEMLLLKRSSGRSQRKLSGDLAREAKLSTSDGYKGENWDKERLGSAQEEKGF